MNTRLRFVLLASVFASACVLFAVGLTAVLLSSDDSFDTFAGVLAMCVCWPLALLTWPPLRAAHDSLLARVLRQRTLPVTSRIVIQHAPPTFWRLDDDRWVPIAADRPATLTWVSTDGQHWVPCADDAAAGTGDDA